jgi:YbgC/YbaW family acyl-CoA thioester hydrolase
MSSLFQYQRRVTFNETDMAGIVHFANFYRYMEEAEHAFFRSLGFSIETIIDGQRFGWPRVETSCRHLAPLRFEDVVTVELMIKQIRPKGLHYQFDFQLGDTQVAVGQISNVCVRMDKDDAGRTKMKASPIPQPILTKLEAFGIE